MAGCARDSEWLCGPAVADGPVFKGNAVRPHHTGKFNDLYRLPQAVLTAIRSYLLQQFPVQLDAPSQVGLLVYDNDHFVVESYRDAPVDVTVSVLGRHSQVRNTVTGTVVSGEPVPPRPKGQMPLTEERTSFKLTILPHRFIALAEQ